MSGINALLERGAKSLFGGAVSDLLTPQQREFAQFALNPQFYIAEKGINAVAELMGYGGTYRELKQGAKDERDYGKEVARDVIGDMLPDSLGDYVRVTPRGDDSPAGMYYDSNVGDFVQSSNPVISSDPFTGDRFGGKYDQNSVYNTNSQNYVGPAYPKDMDSSIYSSNMTDLLEMLGPYEAKETPETAMSGVRDTTPAFDSPIDFGGTMDYSDILGGGGYGGFGGGGDRGNYDYSSYAYAKGGQIYRGRR